MSDITRGITRDKIEAVISKLGGEERVDQFLSGDLVLVISDTAKKFGTVVPTAEDLKNHLL